MADKTPSSKEHWHRRLLEGNATLFAVLTTVAISIGGIAEIIPMFTVHSEHDAANTYAPYSALEVAGRDIYMREGCVQCHSQMVRPFRSETLRYNGSWSRSDEYVWDRPFLLGSRRTGPDLHRVGNKYGDAWHYDHMKDPRSMASNSIMPPYPWLLEWKVDPADIQASMRALQFAGHPYTDAEIEGAPQAIRKQGQGIVDRLAEANRTAEPDDEIVALIAYLQSLGRYQRRDVAEADDGAAEVAR